MAKITDRKTKLAYIQQIIDENMKATDAAKELEVHKATVYSWLKKYREDPENAMPGSGKQKPADVETTKRDRRIRELEAEVEFLKKAAAYFAKSHGKSTR